MAADASITTANTAVGSYSSAGDIVHTAPMNPMVSGSGAAASPDARNAGMAIAAMSRYARTMGMTGSSSGMVTAMVKDASDGVMNGRMGSTAITMGGMPGGMMGGSMMASTAGTTGLSTAVSSFVGSAGNMSGIPQAAMQPLVDKLHSATGTIP